MHHENAIHRVRSCPSSDLIEQDASDSVTVVAATRDANLTLPRGSATLWRKTRYVMLLLNHGDRNHVSPRYFRRAKCTTVLPRQRTFAHNDTRSENVGSESLVTHTRTFERHTRTQPISRVTKVWCYFAHLRIARF